MPKRAISILNIAGLKWPELPYCQEEVQGLTRQMRNLYGSSAKCRNFARYVVGDQFLCVRHAEVKALKILTEEDQK